MICTHSSNDNITDFLHNCLNFNNLLTKKRLALFHNSVSLNAKVNTLQAFYLLCSAMIKFPNTLQEFFIFKN